jgi:23S rRNA G2445 N2-methylase RlmL
LDHNVTLLIAPADTLTGANPWPFFHWPDFQQQQWKQTVQAAKEAQFEGTAAWEGAGGHLLGNDCHAGALKLAQQAAAAAGVAKSITFHQGECRDWQFEKMEGPLLAVCNPPWGLRLLSGKCL